MKKAITFLPIVLITVYLCCINISKAQTWGNNDDRLTPLSHNAVNGNFLQSPFTHVIIEDNVMFFTDQHGFNVYNVSDPSNPVKMGNTPVPGKTSNFTIAGNHAYVCVDFGIAIINIADTNSPQVIHVEFLDYRPYKIIIDEGHAFVAGNDGVRSYSLPNPDELVFLQNLYIQPGNILFAGIEKYGNYIFYVNQVNLHVVDVSNPASMIAGMNISLSPGGSCWGNLAIKDNYLLVVSTQRLRIFDLANPAEPSLVYNDLPASHTIYDIVVEDDYAIVNHNSNQRWTILDITDPANPVSLYENTSPMMYGIYSLGALKNNILHILDNRQENFDGYTMHLVDVSTPTAPLPISTIESEPGKTKGVSVFEKEGNKYALVAQNHTLGSGIGAGGLKIININDPANPQMISELELPNSTIAVEAGTGNYAFVVMATYQFPNWNLSVGLINISNINNPFLSNIQPIGNNNSLVYHNNLSYFEGKLYAVSRSHLRIFAEENGELIQLGNTTVYGQSGTGVYANNPGYVYVTAGNAGFLLYNVTNPASPFMVNFINTTGTCLDVHVYDDFAYVADNEGGLAIIDVSQDFAQPVSQVGSVGNAVSVRTNGETAYLGLDDGRIELFDVSNPQQPVSTGWYLTSGSRINNITIDNNEGLLHVANELEFLILDLEGVATVLPGDANCDGVVNVLDVIAIVNYFVGLEPDPFCFDNADVNGDGVINILDVIGTVEIFTRNFED